MEWVAQRPIFEVCARDTGYEGGGKLQVQRWIQVASENHLKVTLEDILVASRVWRQKESGSCGKSKGGSEGESTYIEG